jgi:hypothetical protein
MYLMNATPLKRYTSQILSYKIFSFCEQILKIAQMTRLVKCYNMRFKTGVNIYF